MSLPLSKTPTAIDRVKNVKQRAFLKYYIANGGIISRAAKDARVDRRYHYKWLAEDEKYQAAFEEARNESMDILVDELHRRAVDGVEKPVFYQGKQVGFVREYSDNLLMFLMKRRDPEYRDNFTQNVGIWSGSGKVNVEFNIPRPPKATEGSPKEEPRVIKTKPLLEDK